MFDIVCVGGATQDVFVRCESAQVIRQSDRLHEKAWIAFDYGAKLGVEQLSFGVGGGATNTAVTFANLELKTACLAKVGHDPAGDQVIADLRRHQIDSSLLVQAQGQTGYSVILTSYEGERSILAFRGLNRELSAQDINWERLAQTRWLYISSLSGPSEALLEPLIHFAAEHGIKVALNPGNRQLEKGHQTLAPLLKKIDLLFMNRDEACRLTGIELKRPAHEALRHEAVHPVRPAFMYDLDPIFKALQGAVREAVVITDGKRGTQVLQGQQVTLLPVYPVKVVDVLGAGDAFASAFTVGWIESGEMATALCWGNANAAGVISNPGAHNGLLTREGIKEMLKRFSQIQPLSYQQGQN